jgi:hypothetical protein
METDDLLIEEVERRGYGIDIRYLRGTCTISIPERGGQRNVNFNSLESALRWIKALDN